MNALIAGFLSGFSLIVAIGAQNAYLLRLGLSRSHIGIAVAICALSDVILIVAGIAGVGSLVRAIPHLLEVFRWIGVSYLTAYGIRSFWRAYKVSTLTPSEVAQPTRRAVILTTLAFTFLNPHVYLDTVLLLGSIGNQYGSHRWFFALGACLASVTWFVSLGTGAKALARVMGRPATWRVLDVGIGIVMLLVAWSIATTHV